MIKSFRGKIAQDIFSGNCASRIPAHLQRAAYRRLRMLHNARSINDLSVFPGNRYEILKGDRKGQSSIRINDQFRICFFWKENDAYEVEIVDYH
jgi:proteic killer suppression protein